MCLCDIVYVPYVFQLIRIKKPQRARRDVKNRLKCFASLGGYFVSFAVKKNIALNTLNAGIPYS